MVQGELFREESSGGSLSNLEGSKRRSFLSRHQLTVSLDKLLVVFIAVTVVFVLTYSFGVEHGKRAMEKRLESLFPTHSERVAPTTPSDETVGAAGEETVLLVNQTTEETLGEKAVKPLIEVPSEPAATPQRILSSVDLTKQGKYTVQLVTYMDQRLAEQEVLRLKAKGHEGFVIPSGRYFQVCADYFESFSRARSLLKQLRDNGRYPDAYVRPVVR